MLIKTLREEAESLLGYQKQAAEQEATAFLRWVENKKEVLP